MNDSMRFGDSVAIVLQCGHPNVKPNEDCPYCGIRLPEKQEIAAADVGGMEERQWRPDDPTSPIV